VKAANPPPAPAAIPEGDALAPTVALEKWIAGVHDEETARLAKLNELESYLYKVRDWTTGKDGALLKPAEGKLDSWMMWVEDMRYEDSTTLAQYTDKFNEIQNFMHTECKEFFDKEAKKKADEEEKLRKEAEAEAARRKELGMDFDKDERKMSKDERFRLAGKNKEEGNELFKAGKHDDAIRRWKKACEHLTRPEVKENLSPEEKEKADAIMTSCYINTAQSYIKAATGVEATDKNAAEPFYKKAMTACDNALQIGENVKARFRRALCYESSASCRRRARTSPRGSRPTRRTRIFSRPKRGSRS
jgi:tetratricopeptide (TPR) repeat protein